MKNLVFGHVSYCVGLCLSLGLATGCAKDKPAESPEATAEVTPVAAVVDENHAPGKTPERGEIRIGPRIAEACGIEEPATYFAYNSSKVSATSNGVFAQLVECFTTGPLAGKTMKIVGHTDPRGDEEYNMTLGGRRADNVAAILASQGLPDGQSQTTSRGEIEANGTDEPSWAKDRKVEILLAED